MHASAQQGDHAKSGILSPLGNVHASCYTTSRKPLPCYDVTRQRWVKYTRRECVSWPTLADWDHPGGSPGAYVGARENRRGQVDSPDEPDPRGHAGWPWAHGDRSPWGSRGSVARSRPSTPGVGDDLL